MVSILPIIALVIAAAAAKELTTQIPDAATRAPTSCASGVQVFIARGSDEPPGMGRIAPIARSIAAAIPGSFITAVDYPARKSPVFRYIFSVSRGTREVKKLVENYAQMCPQSKIVLLGYSQGAQAIGNLLCGASSLGMITTKPLDSKYNQNIVATLLFGDPTRAAKQPFNAGTATDRNGFLPRRRNDACRPYSQRFRSWCDIGDRWCDPNAPSGTVRKVHRIYQTHYQEAAKKFVLEQLHAIPSEITC